MQEKVEKYFELLHPDYDSLTPEERFKLMGEKSFIRENIEEIDKYYQESMQFGGESQQQGVNEKEIIEDAIKNIKVEKYFEMIHPNYDSLSPEERFKLMGEKSFIRQNIDQIDKQFQEAIRDEEVDEHIIIKNIIEGLKAKELSTQQIGKATINVPTTAKVEAEQVENDENTKDNVKEGEEVGDDN